MRLAVANPCVQSIHRPMAVHGSTGGLTIDTGRVAELVEHRPGLTCGRSGGCGSQSSQSNDLYNLYLSLPSLAFGISRIGQGLVSLVSG